MSKHCEVCNRSYSDALDACPHCAEVIEVAEADVVELVEETPEVVVEGAAPIHAAAEPDSAVDLSLPTLHIDSTGSASGVPAGEASGISFVEWASLVEEGPTSPEPAPAQFDDPADADMIGHAYEPIAVDDAAGDDLHATLGVPPVASSPPSAHDDEDALTSDLDAVRSIFAGDASASFARSGPGQPPASLDDEDDSALNLLAPGGAEAPAPVGEPVDSGIDLGAAFAAEDSSSDIMEAEVVEALDSGIDLTSAELEEEVVAEAVGDADIPVIGGVDSGIDLATLMGDLGPAGIGDRGDSGIDLDAVHMVEGASSSEMSSIHVVDSGLNLGELAVADEVLTPQPIAGQHVVRPISDAGIDLSGDEALRTGPDSGPQAGIEQSSPGTSDSGRDLIAEQVESGIALPLESFEVVSDSKVGTGADAVHEIVVGDSGMRLAAGQLPSEAEEVDLTEITAEMIDSSAVDLGASASFPAAPPEPASEAPAQESTRPYEVKSKSIHGGDEAAPSEVDLGARHDQPTGASSGGDFFEESGGLAGGLPVNLTDEEPADLSADEEATAAIDDLEASDVEPAAVEEEATLEEEDETPTRRAKAPKEKRPSKAGAWLGGTLVGGLIGAGVCVLLWLFSIEPPKDWRTLVGGASTATGAAQNGTAAPVALADKVDMIKSGDLDRVQKAGIENVDEAKPEEVAARGEFRVFNYLRQQAVNKAPIKVDDPDMKKGLDDLDKVKAQNADAMFYLGVAREAANDLAGAQKVYQDGLASFKDDSRFADALNRLSAKLGAKPVGRADPAAIDAAALALLLTALEPDPAQPAAPAPAGEAGSVFWRAVKMAHDQQYADALKALDDAYALHTKRRFTVLGKAQNPNSDPTEEIFLRSCEELKAYWQLQDKLHTSTLPVVKGKDPAAALDALLMEDKDLADKLVKANTDSEDLKKTLDTAKKDLDDAKKETETTKKDLDTAKKDLEATKKDLDAAKDDVDAKKKDLAAADKKATELSADFKAAKDDAAKKGEALKELTVALASANFAKPDADESAVLAAVKEMVQVANIKEAGKLIGGLKDEVAGLKTNVSGLKDTLKQRWEPDQMLTYWLPLLRERGRKDLADAAILDADRVLKADKGSAIDKAHAHAVKGVALRDEEKYAEAAKELEQAKADLPKEEGEWILETEAALKEASDPSAYFAAQARTFHNEGRGAEALAMLDRALETAPPAAKTPLLIERGQWRLDEALAHGKGALRADDPNAAAAQKDADEAKKAGAAEAFYLSGRIAEALGQSDAALEEYRQALKAHGALDMEGARYRAALARMLILPRPARPADGKVSRNEGSPPADVALALIAIGLQPGDLPAQTDAATKEALRLADEILSAKEGDVPFEARAQAYAVKGLWTQALTTYVEGIRPRLSPEHAAGLMAIIQGHPSLRRPTLMTLADPLEAEKHYAAGLHWYNDRQYDKAEKEFFTAVEHDGQDARYYYYLGLAHLMQGDRNAYEDFEQGARLEQQNRPPRAAVNAALERIQGAPRQKLNDIRDRPR